VRGQAAGYRGCRYKSTGRNFKALGEKLNLQSSTGTGEVWSDAVGEAGTRVLSALATLQHIFQDEGMPPSSRVSAAKAFIELTKPPGELLQDSLPEGNHAQVVVYLPSNGRGDEVISDHPGAED